MWYGITPLLGTWLLISLKKLYSDNNENVSALNELIDKLLKRSYEGSRDRIIKASNNKFFDLDNLSLDELKKFRSRVQLLSSDIAFNSRIGPPELIVVDIDKLSLFKNDYYIVKIITR